MRRRGAIAAGLLTGIVLVLPGAAQASRVEVSASAGPAAEEYLEYRASKGEANRVSVHISDDHVVIRDTGVKRINLKRTAFGSCRATSRQRVVCPSLSVFVFLRDGNDRLSFAPGADEPESNGTDPFSFDEEYEDSEGAVEDSTYVDAGAGDDRVVGSRFDDVIVPGPGADKVFGRGGPDWISVDADSAADHLRAGGGADALYTDVNQGETVDLVARTLTSATENDFVSGFQRVNTGGGDDTLRGTDGSEALYGGTGNDTVDGRGGHDLLFGDAPDTVRGATSPNTVIGGDGDDFVDVRSREPAPTSQIDCGNGDDALTGETDDRLAPSCERVAFRFGTGETFYEELPDFDHLMRAFPAAREPDRDPVYEVPCPRAGGACTGTLTLESTDATPVAYGSATFDVPTGQTASVAVQLNASGRAAVAAGNPVAARVNGQVARPATQQPQPFNFGWQHVIEP